MVKPRAPAIPPAQVIRIAPSMPFESAKRPSPVKQTIPMTVTIDFFIELIPPSVLI